MINSIGIVGNGSIGRRHHAIIKELYPSVKRVIIKSNMSRKRTTENSFSISDAIKIGIEAAIIASPASLHIEHALKLIKHKVPLLIEKPLSHNLNQIDELEKIKNQKNTLVLIGYCLR